MGRSTAEKRRQLEAFAAARGVAMRTAQNYRKENRPEWVEWLSSQQVESVVEPVLASVGAGEAGLYARARRAADDAAVLMERLQTAAAQCTDAAQLQPMARSVKDARKAWVDAEAYARQCAVAAGAWVPRAAVEDMQRTLLQPLGLAYAALRNNIAGRLPVAQRALFFAAWWAEQGPWENALADIERAVKEGLQC